MMLIWYMMVVWYFGLYGIHGGFGLLETTFPWESIWYGAMAWYFMDITNHFGLLGMVWLPGL